MDHWWPPKLPLLAIYTLLLHCYQVARQLMWLHSRPSAAHPLPAVILSAFPTYTLQVDAAELPIAADLTAALVGEFNRHSIAQRLLLEAPPHQLKIMLAPQPGAERLPRPVRGLYPWEPRAVSGAADGSGAAVLATVTGWHTEVTVSGGRQQSRALQGILLEKPQAAAG